MCIEHGQGDVLIRAARWILHGFEASTNRWHGSPRGPGCKTHGSRSISFSFHPGTRLCRSRQSWRDSEQPVNPAIDALYDLDLHLAVSPTKILVGLIPA